MLLVVALYIIIVRVIVLYVIVVRVVVLRIVVRHVTGLSVVVHSMTTRHNSLLHNDLHYYNSYYNGI